MRDFFRMIRIVGLILRFVFRSAAFGAVPIAPRERRRRRLALLQRTAARACRILGIEVVEDAAFPRDWSGLFVSNHLSFLDIVVHASLRPSVFVTSYEMRDVPIVGWIVRLAGGTFVERRHRGELRQNIESLTELLAQGFSVLLFPEGTTGDGSGVLRFKSGLFSAAGSAGVAVFPTTLNYVRWNGRKVAERDREEICFLGHHSLWTHLGRIFSIRDATVHVSRHIPIAADAAESKIVALRAEQMIAGAYRAFPPDLSSPKRSPSREFPTRNLAATY